MTLNGAIAQLVELENNSTLPEYFKPSIKEVINVLTSDVVERKKGEWIFNPTDAIEMMFTKPKCSECGFESADGGNFCPTCGADMRKEVKR